MTEEQFNEACFFFDQCCLVFDKITKAAEDKRYDELPALAEQHRILMERHKRAKEGRYQSK
jgi:hypothetical protein